MSLATPGAADARPDDSPTSRGDGQSGGAPVVGVDRHHVTRIDIEPTERYPNRHATHGWQVRARRNGERESKFFADARHGTPEDALAAAVAYRDDLLASLPMPTAPRRAWSNTGVVGLSVREKPDGDRARLYVQLNWVDAGGTRRASSYSVDKWGLRRALWNGCLRLYRERGAAGAPTEEPHVMFARAQEPFQDLLVAELAAERAAEQTRAPEAVAPVARPEPRPEPASPAEALDREAETMQRLESILFG